jgi:hypothetical protein
LYAEPCPFRAVKLTLPRAAFTLTTQSRFFLTLGSLLLAAAIGLCAAETGGSLRITITDISGAVIPRAHAHVTGAKNVDVTADSDGIAYVADLPEGNYKITVSSYGFAEKTISGVQVTAGKRRDLVIELEQGLPNSFHISSYQSLEPGMYSKLLDSINEQPFCEAPIPNHVEYYRFLWDPAFLPTVFMRVDMQQNGTAILHVKMLNGGYSSNRLVAQKNITRDLSPDEEVTMLTTLADMGFWNLPSRIEFKDPFLITVDGTQWVIEGVRDGNCHAVTRYSSPLTEIFSKYFLGQVAKLKPYSGDTH